MEDWFVGKSVFWIPRLHMRENDVLGKEMKLSRHRKCRVEKYCRKDDLIQSQVQKRRLVNFST